MSLRRPASRWALWAFAAALLLKSAMPWLATASAQAQGRAVAEVCTVYGVSTVPLGETGHHSSEPGHGADHCALGSLVAVTLDEPRVPTFAPALPRDTGPPPAGDLRAAPDPVARWIERLKHAPPRPA